MGQTSQVTSNGPQGALQIEIACTACGYNLRGLDLEGVCPECGLEIKATIQHGARHRWWLREMLEGVIVLDVVVVCYFVAGLIKFRLPYPYGKYTYFCMICTAWVLTFFAAWKFAKSESDGDESASRRLLRRSSLIYGAFPFVWGVFNGGRWLPLLVFAICAICAVTGVVATFLLFYRMRQIALRLGFGRLATVQLLAGVLAAAIVLLSIPFITSTDMRSGDNSYNLMTTLPSPILGPLDASFTLIEWIIPLNGSQAWFEPYGLALLTLILAPSIVLPCFTACTVLRIRQTRRNSAS